MTKIIDCTFRDGGYYNNWDFSRELISDYLIAMESSGIEIIELGFRTLNKSGFRGPLAYTTDSFIGSFNVPKYIKIGVMVNASELIGYKFGVLEAIRALFCEAQNSPVKVVRIACHIHEFESTIPACKWLKDSGYIVGINLMQVSDRSAGEIHQVLKLCTHDSVDMIYFADSLGSLHEEDVIRILKDFRSVWSGEVGFHAHDNLNKALSNTLCAIKLGIDWVDSTVTGMGRGPGNAQTEYVLLELFGGNFGSGKKTNLNHIAQLIDKHFIKLKQEYKWGPNFYYYLSGQYGIHPTYVQEMLSDTRYDSMDIINTLENLRGNNSKKFNPINLEDGRKFFSGAPNGSWSPAEIMTNKEVLIIGPGESTKKYCHAIEAYIRLREPIVISLNSDIVISEELINFLVACHPTRMIIDASKYSRSAKELIAPISQLPEAIRINLPYSVCRDFGVEISESKFAFNKYSSSIPKGLVLAYALSIATSGKARSIGLVGIDGYGISDKRTSEVNELLGLYMSHPESIKLVSFTPTAYNIPIESIYAQ